MAKLQGAFLPSNPFFADASTSREPKSFHLSKFKFRVSMATTTSFADTSMSNQRSQQAQFPLTAKRTRKPTDNRRAESNTGIAYYLSLLNSNCVSDFKQVHALAVKLNAFEMDCYIANKLAVLYTRNMESLDYARKLFDDMPKRTLSVYSALISAYCRLEQWEDLFLVFALMIDEGVLPDKYLVPTILKACSAMQMTRSGKKIHGYAIRKGLDLDVFVGNALIDMYANCGDLRRSTSVFNSMGAKDVVTWTALVSAYMDEGLLDEATEIFHSMQSNGVKPDLISWNALVSGFARNGEIDLAIQYLEEMQEKGLKPRVNTWNGIISGCAQNKYFEDALDAFYDMLWFPEVPNFVTIASVLPACAGLKNLNLGRAIHGYSLKRQLCNNVHVEGSLIDMYSKCGRNDYSEKVFVGAEVKNTAMWNEMIAAFVNKGKMEGTVELLRLMQNNDSKPDLISYNTILSGLARNGQKDEAYELLTEMVKIDLKLNIVSFNVLISGFQQSGLTYEALKLFQTMQSPSSGCFLNDVLMESIQPNSITITGALAACADLNLKQQGKEIHGYALKNGYKNIYVSSALIHMYSKCHDTVSATKLFRRTEGRNTICWNALIAGYVDNMQPECALKLFHDMLAEGLEPSSSTFMVLLPACGDMAALRSGRQLHGYMLKSQLDESNNTLALALVGMYVKCGSILEAKSVFDLQINEDVGLWNALISSYMDHGMTQNAIASFEQMELSRMMLDY
ncbi:pentatricopeptide repeat-containing protein At1g19720 [Ziziphus jujuba]|uniref:Pentatricopeptide repeat-containing protein At1g19720 n=1 Tax=Ziziphus jujuba TaxID=326968 RepID=A0A6P3ZYB8_ZIZJJ|nr:pentatricopeptide repeat-containing protein At1g19720 [Ziziphus jujuba]